MSMTYKRKYIVPQVKEWAAPKGEIFVNIRIGALFWEKYVEWNRITGTRGKQDFTETAAFEEDLTGK